MANLEAIRDGIMKVIRQRWEDVEVYPYLPQTVRGIPAVVIFPDEEKMHKFDLTYGQGTFVWHLKLAVLVGGDEPDMDYPQLESYVDPANPDSIPALLKDQPDLLMGDGTDSHVEGLSNYGGAFVDSSAAQTGAMLHLTVYTTP